MSLGAHFSVTSPQEQNKVPFRDVPICSEVPPFEARFSNTPRGFSWSEPLPTQDKLEQHSVFSARPSSQLHRVICMVVCYTLPSVRLSLGCLCPISRFTVHSFLCFGISSTAQCNVWGSFVMPESCR